MLYSLPFFLPIYKYIGYLFRCFFTITCIIMFLFLWVIYIFHYRALFCPLLVFLDGVLHTVKNIFGVFIGCFLFFLFCGCYSIIFVQ